MVAGQASVSGWTKLLGRAKNPPRTPGGSRPSDTRSATMSWPVASPLTGPDPIDRFKRAAKYVDRSLKGEKPSDLPVQAPTKYNLVINLQAAKAISLAISPTLVAIADEMIE